MLRLRLIQRAALAILLSGFLLTLYVLLGVGKSPAFALLSAPPPTVVGRTSGMHHAGVKVRLSHDKLEKIRARSTETVKHFILPPKQKSSQWEPLDGAQATPTCSRVDTECWRFRHLLRQWPPGTPRAAIYYLAKSARVHRLVHSLQSVDNFFNNKYHYPIIIFHEADLVSSIPQIRSSTSSDLYFQLIELSTPSFLGDTVKTNIPCMSPIGYRHMCRFQAKLVYQEPVLQGLDYYWRLDDDSVLLSPVQYDVFHFMKSHDLLYGYQWIFWDSSLCTKGLWEATSEFIAKHNITPHFFQDWPRPRLYYNNFEITKLSVWTSREYSMYVDYLDQLGGFYYHRWGDAPIHGLAVSMFVPKNKTHLFNDIAYQHASFINTGLNSSTHT